MTLTFDPAEFGSVLEDLVDVDRSQPLDEGRPGEEFRDALQAASIDSAFGHAVVVDDAMARCCLAGAWLLHGFLDQSHTISQSVETPSGSFWHGMMHRREGDFSNAKYWFRRVGDHEVYESLGKWAANEIADDKLAGRLAAGGAWDAFAFVDACQAAVRSGAGADVCRRIQQSEWELLFQFCFRRATGA
jgi:hypothetical protein